MDAGSAIPTSLLITRGVRAQSDENALAVEPPRDATSRSATAASELQLNTCIHWLDLAYEHLREADCAHASLLTTGVNGREGAALLDREFKASMQAVVAAACFFESLSSATLECENRPPREGPRPGPRGSRSARVAEQLRRAFGLRKRRAASLASVVREIYRFHDQVVHPTSAFSTAVLHPELGVRVERRFVAFRFNNVKILVRAAIAFSKILPSRDLSKRSQTIRSLAVLMTQACAPLHTEWEQSYGALLDPPKPGSAAVEGQRTA